MKQLQIAIKLIAPIFFLVALFHLVLGLSAEQMLGAQIETSVVSEPSLSSQNRFFGISFSLFGSVLWLSATDLKLYAPFFKATMGTMLAAGVARLYAWSQFGAPSKVVMLLLASELITPPILLVWYAHANKRSA